MIKTANNVDNFHIRQVEVREDIVAIQDVVIINIKEVVVEVAGNHLSTMQFLCNSAFMVLEHKLFSHLGKCRLSINRLIVFVNFVDFSIISKIKQT